MRRLVVTIDGPAGAGKSSVAKRLAHRLGYRLLDTGAIYRSVALAARRRSVSWDDAAGCADVARGLDVDFAWSGADERNHVLLDGEDVSTLIREPAISDGASRVSALPEVRAALLELQRHLARAGGVVVEGRDVGTVVFPNADAKFFLTASTDVRARRRADELRAAGKAVDEVQVRSEMMERDHRDSSRETAPLRQAEDALFVDSSLRTLDEVVGLMETEVRKREG